MFVVTVEFLIRTPHIDSFSAAILANARLSLRDEPGCRQFDVDIDPTNPASIFLYEVYDDRAAFDTHCASPHFESFDRSVGGWIEHKHVRFLTRLTP